MRDFSHLSPQAFKHIIFDWLQRYPVQATTTQDIVADQMERKFKLAPGYGLSYLQEWYDAS
jgi:hypothetical protein